MYSKKYILEKIEEFNEHNPIYDDMENSVCYLAYLNIGERGWFLCETNDWFDNVHKIHTSTIQFIEYMNDCIFVETLNTRYTFRFIF